MKSIMEEASSLAKAFAQAWEHAGKPQECTVKILAESEKNFLGLTTKSAKIALFFNEPPAHSFGAKKPSAQTQSVQQQPARRQQKPVQEAAPQRQPQQRRAQQERQRLQEPRAERAKQPSEQQLELIPTQKTPKTEVPPRIRPTWTDEMNQAVHAWVKESLTIMGSDATFETVMARSTLTLTFNKPIIEDGEKERLLFRSWAHLIVQHVKQNFKVHGKELKIILKGSRS